MKNINFFDFGSKFLSSTVQVHVIKESGYSLSTNNIWGLVKGNYSGIEFPITFKQEYGKNWTDVLDTGWPSRYLISSKLKDILESHSFTGWKTFPVKLYDKKSNEIFGYYGFSVIGKCASIDFNKSKIIERQYAPNAPVQHYYKGEFVDLDQWDGSDFFCPEDSYDIFVTQRVAKTLKENKITNLYLKDLNEVEINVDYVKK